MPVYGRLLYDGTPRHAEIDLPNNRAHFLDDFFGTRIKTGEAANLSELKILAPVAPPKLFAIGLNYADHAAESGQAVPKEPLMWFKAPTAVIADGETVVIARPDHRTDYEAELVIVIGKGGKSIKEENAGEHVLGYTNGQDISDRVVQRSESQWARAKSFDTYAPLGPFIYTDIDPDHLPVETRVNGEARQSSNTDQMIFKPHFLVAFLSTHITLQAGDCIMTGTPFGIAPLKDGDIIETRIGEMRPLTNPVRFSSP